jgi:DNA-binding transcriptional regulator YiaG
MSEVDPFEDEEYNRLWLERTLARVVQDTNGCWIWQGPKQRRGYGIYSHKYLSGHHVHRIMYQLAYGQKLGRWDYVCHACDVTSCVNPAHMWIGTPADNQKDMQRKRRGKYQTATHCKQGHEFTPENTWVHKKTNHRHCRTCARISNRLKAGWTREQAESLPRTPAGETPVNGRTDRTRKTAPAVRSNLTPDEIRSLLASAGISQVNGAKLIGVSERTMRRCIAGEIRLIEPAAKALRQLTP